MALGNVPLILLVGNQILYDLEFQSKEVNLSGCQLELATSWQTIVVNCQT